ncbi:hypothetical protein Bbelb_087680 [Branchiostoma belcheri]|nr:hypothetical protein Bbelb_087680 [Branchiostoma belcheri]
MATDDAPRHVALTTGKTFGACRQCIARCNYGRALDCLLSGMTVAAFSEGQGVALRQGVTSHLYLAYVTSQRHVTPGPAPCLVSLSPTYDLQHQEVEWSANPS